MSGQVSPLVAPLISLGGGIVNTVLGNHYADEAAKQQLYNAQKLYKFQYDNYLSPSAQVSALGKAGLNPAAMFGNSAPVNVGGSMAIPSLPQYGVDVGTQSLSSLAQFLTSVAQAKKAGVETKSIEQDVDAKRLQNDIVRTYGMPKAAQELALAFEQVKLAKQSGDLNEIDKSLKNWSVAKEHALSEASAHQRDILKKQLDNEDIRLDIQNRLGEEQVKTEHTRQDVNRSTSEANRASAVASRASAEANLSQADINRQESRIRRVLADVESESFKDKLQALLQEYKAKELISDNDYNEAMLRGARLADLHDKYYNSDTNIFREVDGFLEWIKGKISIFK